MISIDVNPNTALVTCPLAVAMSDGSAKNARYVSELPSTRRYLRHRRAADQRGSQRAVEDPLGDVAHRVRSLIAVRWMNVNASHSVIPHSSISTPLARSISLARLELLAERVDLAGEVAQLAEATDRDLDRRDQVALLERLDEVGQGAGVARLLDHLALAEGGEDQHAADLLGG